MITPSSADGDMCVPSSSSAGHALEPNSRFTTVWMHNTGKEKTFFFKKRKNLMKLILICCYYAHIDLFGLGFYMRVMVLFETSGITRQMCCAVDPGI